MTKWGSAMDLDMWGSEAAEGKSYEEILRHTYAQVLINLAWKIEHGKSEVTGEYIWFIPNVIRAKILTENLDQKLVLECLEEIESAK